MILFETKHSCVILFFFFGGNIILKFQVQWIGENKDTYMLYVQIDWFSLSLV